MNIIFYNNKRPLVEGCVYFHIKNREGYLFFTIEDLSENITYNFVDSKYKSIFLDKSIRREFYDFLTTIITLEVEKWKNNNFTCS